MQSSWISTAHNYIADLYGLNAHSNDPDRLAAVNELLRDYTFIYRDSDRQLPPEVHRDSVPACSHSNCLTLILAVCYTVFHKSNAAIPLLPLFQEKSHSKPRTVQLGARRATAPYLDCLRGDSSITHSRSGEGVEVSLHRDHRCGKPKASQRVGAFFSI